MPHPGACRDRTFQLAHHWWVTGYRYRIQIGSVPQRYHRATVVKQIRAANANMRLGHNSCGKAHLRTPAARYLGHTKAHPDISADSARVTCGDYNTRNVIGFGRLPGNLLGWTCTWWLNDGHLAAADMRLDNGKRLATKLPATCTDTFDFEGLVTHEMGHLYGLAHTGPGHANLTMRTRRSPARPTPGRSDSVTGWACGRCSASAEPLGA